MNIKKIIKSSLLIGSLYTSASFALITCEKSSPGNFVCEYTNHQIGNAYSWTTSGQIGISSGSGPFRSAFCTVTPASGSVSVVVTKPSGATSTHSKFLSCQAPFQGFGYF